MARGAKIIIASAVLVAGATAATLALLPGPDGPEVVVSALCRIDVESLAGERDPAAVYRLPSPAKVTQGIGNRVGFDRVRVLAVEDCDRMRPVGRLEGSPYAADASPGFGSDFGWFEVMLGEPGWLFLNRSHDVKYADAVDYVKARRLLASLPVTTPRSTPGLPDLAFEVRKPGDLTGSPCVPGSGDFTHALVLIRNDGTGATPASFAFVEGAEGRTKPTRVDLHRGLEPGESYALSSSGSFELDPADEVRETNEKNNRLDKQRGTREFFCR